MTQAAQAMVVFTRLPRHEQKALLTQRNSSIALHTSLILHTLQRANQVPVHVALILVADGALPKCLESALASMARPVHVLQQHGRGFEARFLNALEDAASLGYKRLVAVGTDTPSLQTRDLERALSRPDITLGPSCDGGFYLIGLPTEALACLEDLPWQQEDLLLVLRQRLGEQGLVCSLLAIRADLDSPGDVRRGLSHLARLVRRCTGLLLEARAWCAGVSWRSSGVRGSQGSFVWVVSPRGPPCCCS